MGNSFSSQLINRGILLLMYAFIIVYVFNALPIIINSFNIKQGFMHGLEQTYLELVTYSLSLSWLFEISVIVFSLVLIIFSIIIRKP